MNKINEHYVKVAAEWGSSKQSTMKDINIRDLEVDKLIDVFKKIEIYSATPTILEVGCGNGYVAEQIVKRLNISSMTCVDYCQELVEIAKRRKIEGVVFKTGDVLNLEFDDSSFDIVFTERCLINLDSWEKQQKSLLEIRRILKKNGIYIMIESFSDGLKNINAARGAVGLDDIPMPFHNLFFEKERFFDFIEGKFQNFSASHPKLQLENCENFLSSYYFGSKVLYPALIAGKRKLEYNNKFIEFFKYMPNYGNYGYVNMFILKKI